MHRCIAALVISLALLAACGGDAGSGSTIRGVVVEVRSEGLTKVKAFTVKAGDEFHEILIDPERDYDFPLDHLHEHRVSAQPVVVVVEERNGDLYALTIDDA